MDLILTTILEFYETLSPNLQALETMGKIKEVNGYVRMMLDKMEGIRENLVHTDDNWQDWEFPHLLEHCVSGLQETHHNQPMRDTAMRKHSHSSH